MCSRRKQQELLQGNFSSFKSRLTEAYHLKIELEKVKLQLSSKRNNQSIK